MRVGMAETTTAFLDAVAARTPAPGGGAGAAFACALAAALVEMAARFGELDEAAARAAALRAEALRLREEDLSAYAPVLEALALPRDDPERSARVARTSSAAAGPPLAIAEAAAEVAALGRDVAAAGKPALPGTRSRARISRRARRGRPRGWWRSTSPAMPGPAARATRCGGRTAGGEGRARRPDLDRR